MLYSLIIMSKEKDTSQGERITDIFKKQKKTVVIPEEAKLPQKTKKVKPTDPNSKN